MLKQHRGFMAFRYPEDAERYCDSKSEQDQKAVRQLWDAGKAAYTTEAADFAVIERFNDKPYVKIENIELWPFPMYISNQVADGMRWKVVAETDYRAEDWINAAFYAWTDDDLNNVDRLFHRAAEAPDATPAQIAKSLLLRAAVVEALERPDEALDLLGEITERFGESKDADVRPYVAEAMSDRGGLLGRTGRHAEAIAAYDAAILRFGTDTDPRVRLDVLRAWVKKVAELCAAGQFEDALDVNERILASYDDFAQPRAREQLALAYRNKAVALNRLSRMREAIEACDALISGFSGASEKPIIAAWALCYKASLLGKISRQQEANASYRELVTRFVGIDDAGVQRLVGHAQKELSDQGAS